MRKIIIFIRCIYTNKIALFGYINLFVYIILLHSSNPSPLLILISFIFMACGLSIGEFGIRTYEAYCRIKKHLNIYGYTRTINNLEAKNLYCFKCGSQLAVKDFLKNTK